MTTQLEQAAKQALEALQFALHVGFDESSESQIKKGGKAFDQHNAAITALRAALDEPTRSQKLRDAGITRRPKGWDKDGDDEQPAQDKPVAYIHRQGNHWEVSERILLDDEKARGWTEEPLYTRPQPVLTNDTSQNRVDETAKQRHKQPCPYVVSTREGTHHCSLSAREWVGLTESEIIRCSSVSILRFYDAIEAKLREKNA